MKIAQKYIIKSFRYTDNESCDFLYRQIKRMPDYYHFGLNIILVVFYFFSIPYQRFELLNRLFKSLSILKKYESK